MLMKQEEPRKGPWTEKEDVLLINVVHLFGDRRWDFIAKVSGINRTGKSCRLRWVNYLHPGLKRDKMTPQEERLVLELHAKWGNRWSRIARKLPGRTDNDIKNYCRTHMRKKAQERKRAMSPFLSSSNCSSSSNTSTTITTLNSSSLPETGETSFYDTGGPKRPISEGEMNEDVKGGEKGCYVDDIWKDIENTIEPDGLGQEGGNIPFSMPSPPWDYCPHPLWSLGEEDSKMFLPYEDETVFLTG